MTLAMIRSPCIDGGKHWSLALAAGTSMTLVDVGGGANVGMIFYNPHNLLERYNMPDTLKCQHTFKLTRGHCLYSDMGTDFLLYCRRFRRLARHRLRQLQSPARGPPVGNQDVPGASQRLDSRTVPTLFFVEARKVRG